MDLFVGFLQMNELLIVAVMILLLFGGSKIPQLMRGLGRGAGEFQRGLEEGKRALEEVKRQATVESSEDKDKDEQS
ncbi:MAG: twin-arginine translocase TatA/TatE family subunit [Armatimonadetes bacterium]|nr:MAG: twin-arginine translocase TatA/TatE family subunit [Armatimonadota bacterium]